MKQVSFVSRPGFQDYIDTDREARAIATEIVTK
jgi:hypothetical protein